MDAFTRLVLTVVVFTLCAGLSCVALAVVVVATTSPWMLLLGVVFALALAGALCSTAARVLR